MITWQVGVILKSQDPDRFCRDFYDFWGGFNFMEGVVIHQKPEEGAPERVKILLLSDKRISDQYQGQMMMFLIGWVAATRRFVS